MTVIKIPPKMIDLSTGQRILVRVATTIVILGALWAMGILKFGGATVY